MFRLNIVVLSLAGLLVAALPLRADAPSAKERQLARENAVLKSRIDSLEAEVNALKARLNAPPDLQLKYGPLPNQAAPDGSQTIPSYPFIPPAASTPRWPEGTVRKEFNGSPLYLIPISRDTATTRK